MLHRSARQAKYYMWSSQIRVWIDRLLRVKCFIYSLFVGGYARIDDDVRTRVYVLHVFAVQSSKRTHTYLFSNNIDIDFDREI